MLPSPESTDDDSSRLLRAAQNRFFVITSYSFAFLPWVVYGVVDHVDSRWRKLRRLSFKTWTALVVCSISLVVLVAYMTLQFLTEDWREAMTTLGALLATWLPVHRVCRQVWLLYATKDLGTVLRSLPNLGGVSFRDAFKLGGTQDDEDASWDPGNSNKFFDNDAPGEGVSNLSLCEWLLKRDMSRWAVSELRHWEPFNLRLQDCILFGGEGVEELYDEFRYGLAMDLLRYRLRAVGAGEQGQLYRRQVVKGITAVEKMLSTCLPEDKVEACVERLHNQMDKELPEWFKLVKGAPAKYAEDGLTRAVWLYENLTGRGWLSKKRGKLARVLHLGLVVHVGMVVVNCFQPGRRDLNWVEVLANSGCQLEYGHLQQPGELLQAWFPDGDLSWFPKEDFDEVFAKLPPERSSARDNGHLSWQLVMFMACSTIELHTFVEVLLGKSRFTISGDAADPVTPAEEIWKYIIGAHVANRCKAEVSHMPENELPQMLHNACSALPYRDRLDSTLVSGQQAAQNWNEIIIHCGNVADIVTHALRRTQQQREQPLLPDAQRGLPWTQQLQEILRDLEETLNRLLLSS
eukprot:evm.model.scf_888.1 EVM.evm.TU.scf_888.1   scf_888:7061-9184(-)